MSRRLFLERLGSADPMLRAAAARGLAARPSAADLDPLLFAYERAQTDSVSDARLAIVEALGELRTHGVPADRSFFLRFERSGDPLVRAAVAARLGDRWGDPRPIETRYDDAGYLDVVRRLIEPAWTAGVVPRVRVRTGGGDIELALAPFEAPLTVDNLLRLIDAGWYTGDALRWHRVVPNFVLQDGDRRGDGLGGPAWAIRDEINPLRYLRGTLGMALSGPDTGGSQFFLTHSPQPHLDGGYTVFGRVTGGQDVADAVVQDDPILSIERVVEVP